MNVNLQARPVTEAGRARWWATLALLGCVIVLGVAVYVRPDPRGFGTHAALGFGPCGMLVTTGYPCPTCGMTTAFAYVVRGQWLRALWAQPAGFVLGVGTIGLAGVAAWTIVRGRWPRVNLGFMTPYRLFLGLLVLLLGSWAFKIVVGLMDHSLPYR